MATKNSIESSVLARQEVVSAFRPGLAYLIIMLYFESVLQRERTVARHIARRGRLTETAATSLSLVSRGPRREQ